MSAGSTISIDGSGSKSVEAIPQDAMVPQCGTGI